MKIEEIQAAIRDEGVDGWLFFDHHQRDPLAYRILRLDTKKIPTRRWYYLIPATGEPRALVHKIEPFMLDSLPGAKTAYSSWTMQLEGLREMLRGCRRVAMQYSPDCAVPYVSMVDAGTLELVRGTGVEVVSSANLVQYFEARWTQAQLDSHLEAGRLIDDIRRQAFNLIGERLRAGHRVDEWGIKRFILDSFEATNLITDHGPNVSVNANCSNPHYDPSPSVNQEIHPGDWVLIDLWAKFDRPGAVYYDITWTGYCGAEPPSAMQNVFDVVRGARDCALECVRRALTEGRTLHGFEVDDAARGYIAERGFGEHFFHRTGHSLGVEVHGAGANMDNLETHDERRIIPWTGFSVEPGIYLPEFGVRSEVNVFAGPDGARVTGEVQESPVVIL